MVSSIVIQQYYCMGSLDSGKQLVMDGIMRAGC